MPKQKNTTKKTAVKAGIASKKSAKKDQKLLKELKPAKKQTKVAKASTASRNRSLQNDGPYLIKLTLFALLGLAWVTVAKASSGFQVPIPIGFIIGIILVSHERFQIDRKIAYAVLLAGLLVGFIAPFDIYLSV